MKRFEEMNGKGWAAGVLVSFAGTLCPGVIAPICGFALVICVCGLALWQC